MIIHPLGDLNWRLAPGSWLGIGDLSLFRSSRLIFPSSSHLLSHFLSDILGTVLITGSRFYLLGIVLQRFRLFHPSIMCFLSHWDRGRRYSCYNLSNVSSQLRAITSSPYSCYSDFLLTSDVPSIPQVHHPVQYTPRYRALSFSPQTNRIQFFAPKLMNN